MSFKLWTAGTFLVYHTLNSAYANSIIAPTTVVYFLFDFFSMECKKIRLILLMVVVWRVDDECASERVSEWLLFVLVVGLGNWELGIGNWELKYFCTNRTGLPDFDSSFSLFVTAEFLLHYLEDIHLISVKTILILSLDHLGKY
jgi:hypothetical protein